MMQPMLGFSPFGCVINTRAEIQTVPKSILPLPCVSVFNTQPAKKGKASSCRQNALTTAACLFLRLALLLLLEHLLDNLLLLDQERADDTVTHAVAAPRTTVCALDGLLGLGDLGVLAGSQSGDLCVDSISSYLDRNIPHPQKTGGESNS